MTIEQLEVIIKEEIDERVNWASTIGNPYVAYTYIEGWEDCMLFLYSNYKITKKEEK